MCWDRFDTYAAYEGHVPCPSPNDERKLAGYARRTDSPQGEGECGHCGRTDVGTHDAGYGSAEGMILCHPNVPNRPDCYRLVTLHGHSARCNLDDECKNR